MISFKNAGIRAKIVAICTLLSLFVVGMGASNYFSLQEVTNKYTHVSEINMPNAVYLAQLREFYRRARIHLSLLAVKGSDAKKREDSVQEIKKAMADFDKIRDKYLNVPFVEGEQALWDKVEATWKRFPTIVENTIRLARSASPEDAAKLDRIVLVDMEEFDSQFGTDIGTLTEFQNAEAAKWGDEAKTSASRSKTLIVVVIFAAFGIAQVIAYFFSRSLSSQLSNLSGRLSEGAGEVAAASVQVAQASTELSSSATEQAAALQETVASLDEVSAMVNKNSDNAKRSQEISSVSQSAAEKGKATVDEMIESIDSISRSNDEIMKQIEDSNREMAEIVSVITEIGTKTKVINDIVFQTKLLSFNASVEAARAGEHGKGFAVVAEEVGKLAQMSGGAAKEISDMLEGSIRKVEGIASSTGERIGKLTAAGKEKVESGTRTARRCGEVLGELVGHVANVAQMSAEIATACQEQAQGVQEINKAMGQLDQVTQQNASASQQASAAAERLTAQAARVRSVVQELNSTVQGEGGAHQGSQQGFQGGVQPESPRHRAAETHAAPKKTANVIPFDRPKKAVAAAPASASVRKAASGESASFSVPAENDPRFEDV